MKISHIIDEKLQENKECKVTGLIHPNDKVLECEFFQHLESAKKHPEFLIESVRVYAEELNRELQIIGDSCKESQENGEHPEWHIWEMAADDFNFNFLGSLYKHGYLRFYIHFKFQSSQTFEDPQLYANITLEGLKDKIEAHKDLIIYLQNKYRVHLTIEKR